eukprot:TRINITY_DN73401_c0_g1_i1.p1 TRINITY_DN73401_c0_g1~~TRINITY_DN73401_c0_g1_i1.p1  ORF type:complete len:186 (+),score=3.26 TRINITY_DN73401_c0_g1_i1:198-755(+)
MCVLNKYWLELVYKQFNTRKTMSGDGMFKKVGEEIKEVMTDVLQKGENMLKTTTKKAILGNISSAGANFLVGKKIEEHREISLGETCVRAGISSFPPLAAANALTLGAEAGYYTIKDAQKNWVLLIIVLVCPKATMTTPNKTLLTNFLFSLAFIHNIKNHLQSFVANQLTMLQVFSLYFQAFHKF